MAEESLSHQVVTLRNMLNVFDAQLAQTATPPGGLEDLKRAVDNLRTSVWAVLSAAGSANFQASLERFKLRRLIDFTRGILAEMDGGGMTTLHPEHAELQIISQQLVERIGRLRPSRP